MKITSDLRAAVRSACNAQPQENWEIKKKARAKAIQELLQKKPAVAKKHARYKQLKAQVQKLGKEMDDISSEIGFREDYEGALEIRDEPAFLKIGGKLPGQEVAKWKFDTAMKEIAAADPRDEKAVLAKFGIRWE